MQLKDANKWRWLAVAVIVWSGYVLHAFAFWFMDIPPDKMGMHHAAAITGFTGGIAAIFKFALDFALDGSFNRGGND